MILYFIICFIILYDIVFYYIYYIILYIYMCVCFIGKWMVKLVNPMELVDIFVFRDRHERK